MVSDEGTAKFLRERRQFRGGQVRSALYAVSGARDDGGDPRLIQGEARAAWAGSPDYGAHSLFEAIISSLNEIPRPLSEGSSRNPSTGSISLEKKNCLRA